MINDHNIAKTRVWKMQIPMHVNFNSSKGTEEVRTIDVWSVTKTLCGVTIQIILLMNFLNLF